MFSAAPCDHRFDAAFAQSLTMRVGIVTTIGIDDLGSLKWSAARAADRGNRVNERQQLGDIVAVRAGQDGADGNAIGVYEDMVLGTGSRAIRGVRASFSPAPTARTDEESTAAYERSIRPASRNLSSSSSCSRSHTPALRQSFSRRQQVAPEPKPNTVGRWFHRRLVFKTNRMPFSAARSDTRGRPGCSLRRGLGGGSNGSVRVHNSSSMIGASIPWVPLFRHPGLTACRESKQPPQGFLNWPLSGFRRGPILTCEGNRLAHARPQTLRHDAKPLA
ncbi:hypothetical protein R52603_05138 [Paraburkholderia saeva]|nr:hypothetical protein R52603_05138 [Paraburkholderia saeva]